MGALDRRPRFGGPVRGGGASRKARLELGRGAVLLFLLLLASPVLAQGSLPELTAPVNDFANIVDPASAADIDRMSRALQQATGDAVVVATMPTVEPYADVRELAVKLFENHGRGIGEKGKDNGVLIVLALKERRVWVEVGYGLEEFVTDGFAGETSRVDMVPAFRRGAYGEGLKAGVARIIGRIAGRRGVTLDAVPRPREARPQSSGLAPLLVIVVILVLILAISQGSGPPTIGTRRRGPWGSGFPWSGWSSGVGPFGGGGSGGFGGGFGGFGGGGGGGGGFGGFGGGRSGGGGGGAGW
jgi:uncharacterized protein